MKKERNLTAYLMLLPDVLGLTAFVFIPMVFALWVAFHQWSGLGKMQWVGMANFRNLFLDTSFLSSLATSFKYFLFYVPSLFCGSLFMAILVKQLKGKTQNTLKSVYFLPFAVSSVVSSFAWIFLYDPRSGYINIFLSYLGFNKQAFLTSVTQALPSVALVSVWMVLGYNVVLFFAALSDIPISYYEAAEIDGVGSFQKFVYITFPLLRNTSVFVILTATLSSFQVFDQVRIMTRGGPASATDVAAYHIFHTAFELGDIGYACAMAFILLLVLGILSILQAVLAGTTRPGSR